MSEKRQGPWEFKRPRGSVGAVWDETEPHGSAPTLPKAKMAKAEEVQTASEAQQAEKAQPEEEQQAKQDQKAEETQKAEEEPKVSEGKPHT